MKQAQQKKPRSRFLFIIKEAFVISLYVFTMFSIPILIGFLYLWNATKLSPDLLPADTAQTSYIYDRTGEHLLYSIHDEEDRQIIPHSQIPDTVRIATIATEDSSFYSHPGIDPLAILRAFKHDISVGRAEQGASTITQQLARSIYLNRNKTVERKIMEAVYALKIEREYSKEQILDAYLNEVPYGSNAYGIETASKTFFGKSAKDVSLDEAALLAALTKAPSYYSPYGSHTRDLIIRQKQILDQIEDLKLAPPDEISIARETDTLSKIKPFSEPILAPHFVFYVQDALEKKYGQNFLKTGGLKIYTSLDYDQQVLAENIIKSDDARLKSYGAENAALVSIDPRTGQILAMVGSKDYFSSTIDGQVNVTTSPRQPGSSFKPIVYAKAFENGYQPETLVLDARTDFGPDGSGRNYVPQNYSNSYHGVISMRQALAMSLNIPAIKTLRAVGLPSAIDMAHRLGITTLNEPERYGLSLVIGGGEVTLLDETSAFSVFANDGKRNPVDPFLKIKDNTGNVIYENKTADLSVLDAQIARKINSILSDNASRTPVFGPRSNLYIAGRNVAAKTGTTQEFRDGWTVGYTPDLAVGVWTGNNDGRPMRGGADGSFVAAPIWHKFMVAALNEYPERTFLAYNKTSESNSAATSQLDKGQYEKKTVYYRIASGKKISKEKAAKLGNDKVRKETIIVSPDGEEFSFSNQAKPVF